MHETEIFVSNIDRLMKEKGITSYAELANKVNSKHNQNVVTPPYISKIRKSIKQGKPQNISLDFIGYFATFFGVSTYQMLQKSSGDETYKIDTNLLLNSVSYALGVSENVGIKDAEFISAVTSAAYQATMENNEANLIHQVLRLIKPYVSNARPEKTGRN